MEASRRTRVFLLALGLGVLALVTHDALRPRTEREPAPTMAEPAEQAPAVRRLLDKTPLLYAGEYLENLLNRLAPALVVVRPAQPPASVGTPGFTTTDGGEVVVALSGVATEWQVRTVSGELAKGTLVGADAIHGVALIASNLAHPALFLETAGGGPGNPGDPLIGLRAHATDADVRLLAAPGATDSEHLETRLRGHGLQAGEVVVDLDGRVLAFTANTEEGPRPLLTLELLEILDALRTRGHHSHPWIGLDLQTIDGRLRVRFPVGALVAAHVEPHSPAAAAGIQAGTTFENVRTGDQVATTAEQVEALLDAGTELTMVPASVPEPRGRRRPATLPDEYTVTVLDRQVPRPLITADAALGGIVAAGAREGVPIVVAPGSAAAFHGLLTGDVVEAIDLQPVASAEELEARFADAGVTTLLTVRRGPARFLLLIGEVPAAQPQTGDAH